MNPSPNPNPNPNPKATNNNNNKFSKFVHVITFPGRILAKARDMYVSSLMSCASRVGQPYVSLPRGRHELLPRSLSVGSSSRFDRDNDDDLRELMRAASIRTLLKDDRFVLSLKGKTPTAEGPKGLPKSCSVIMGRIDEDKAFDETGSDISSGVGSLNRAGLRIKSRSYAAGNRSSVF